MLQNKNTLTMVFCIGLMMSGGSVVLAGEDGSESADSGFWQPLKSAVTPSNFVAIGLAAGAAGLLAKAAKFALIPNATKDMTAAALHEILDTRVSRAISVGLFGLFSVVVARAYVHYKGNSEGATEDAKAESDNPALDKGLGLACAAVVAWKMAPKILSFFGYQITKIS